MIQKNWNKTVDDKIEVPDELEQLVNSVLFQFNFVQLYGLSIEEAACNIVEKCRVFFTEYSELLKNNEI